MTRSAKLKITGSGRYPLIPLLTIKIAERPEPGQEASRLFYNPRSLDSFTTEKMLELMESIRLDGLQQPPIVRVRTSGGKHNGAIESVELIAGERRLRSLLKLYNENIDCFDDQTRQMQSAQVLYESVQCKVLYNINDEEALRVAFIENNEHQSLSIKEEIDLVERLTLRGLKQDEIVKMLSTNVTWVSQTSNFRSELPKEAFDKLLLGKLTRHVAVQILSYKPEDRDSAYRNSVLIEERERAKVTGELREEVERGEDLEQLADLDIEEAMEAGDLGEAKKQEKAKQQAIQRAKRAADKLKRVQEEAGVIRQGHLLKGAQLAGVSPKKAKTLTKDSIQQFMIDMIDQWIETNKIDPITKEPYPIEMLELLKAAGQYTLNGDCDMGKLIRTVQVKMGNWTLPDGYVEKTTELLEVCVGDEELM